ncbi:MAG: septum formation initiator family protein [Rikenellaceae bacterium]
MEQKKRKINLFTNTQIIVIATLVFASLYFIFDTNNYYAKRKLEEKRDQLLHKIDSIKAQITADSTEIELLKHDDTYLEKYAREHFYMLRQGEDIYVVDDEDSIGVQ